MGPAPPVLSKPNLQQISSLHSTTTAESHPCYCPQDRKTQFGQCTMHFFSASNFFNLVVITKTNL
jgi:hypothetical protein